MFADISSLSSPIYSAILGKYVKGPGIRIFMNTPYQKDLNGVIYILQFKFNFLISTSKPPLQWIVFIIY